MMNYSFKMHRHPLCNSTKQVGLLYTQSAGFISEWVTFLETKHRCLRQPICLANPEMSGPFSNGSTIAVIRKRYDKKCVFITSDSGTRQDG